MHALKVYVPHTRFQGLCAPYTDSRSMCTIHGFKVYVHHTRIQRLCAPYTVSRSMCTIHGFKVQLCVPYTVSMSMCPIHRFNVYVHGCYRINIQIFFVAQHKTSAMCCFISSFSPCSFTPQRGAYLVLQQRRIIYASAEAFQTSTYSAEEARLQANYGTLLFQHSRNVGLCLQLENNNFI